MEQGTRDEINASAAVHAELGRDYDHAVAEGLVERIGAEIDKRVDARLDRLDRRPRKQARPGRPGTFAIMVMALGSMGLGVAATAVVLSDDRGGGTGMTVVVLVIWLAIAIMNGIFITRE